MRLILHIGQHKTGSKALQAALYGNPELLAAGGSVYPRPSSSGMPLKAWEKQHHALFVALRRRAALEGSLGKHHASVTNAQEALQETLQTLIERVAHPAKTFILSSEDLFDMHTAHENQFDPELIPRASGALAEVSRRLGVEVLVVCYLRRQDYALAAHYAQFIKGTQENSLPLWRFWPRFAGRLDYEWILASWARAFGAGAIVLRSYQTAVDNGGVVQDFFTHVLGLAPPQTIATTDPEATNISPSRDHLEYMRILNRRACAGGAVVSRSQVLDSARRDPHPGARGPAAWLSPKARALLLARYGPGNARLAARYGAVSDLSATAGEMDLETPPSALRAPPMKRLLDLDAMSRETNSTATRRSRLALFVVPPDANPESAGLAQDLLVGMLGHPELRPLALADWSPGSALRHWRDTALVVLSGPIRVNFIATQWLAGVRKRGTPVIVCVGKFPDKASDLNRLQRTLVHATLLVCSNEVLAAQLIERLPAGARPEIHAAPRGHLSLFHLGQALTGGRANDTGATTTDAQHMPTRGRLPGN